MIHAILKNKLQEVKSLFRKYKVKNAYAFGSVCTEKFNDESDIDFLISFENGLDPIEYGNCYFALADALEALLKRNIDLVTEVSLRNPYFIKIVNRTKTPIYE